MRCRLPVALGAATLLAAGTAAAHVGLERRQAPPGTTFKAVFQIGHGCNGAPTTSVRIRMPEGVVAVKPMPKSGWGLQLTEGDYATPYTDHGRTITKGVTEVAWTGGELLDAHYDEFVVRFRLTDLAPGTKLYFPVVQECREGVHRWIEIPADGQDPDELAEPAPMLEVIEADPGAR